MGTVEPTPELIAEIGRETDNAQLIPLSSSVEESQPEPKTLLKENVIARYTLADFKRANDMDIVIGTLKRPIEESERDFEQRARDKTREILSLLPTGQGPTLCKWTRDPVSEREDQRIRNCFCNHSMMIMSSIIPSRSVVPDS